MNKLFNKYLKIIESINCNRDESKLYSVNDKERWDYFERYYCKLYSRKEELEIIFKQMIAQEVVEYSLLDEKKLILTYFEKYILPVINKLEAKQACRIGNNVVRIFDRTKYFSDSYPKLKFYSQDLVAETNRFFKEKYQFNLENIYYSSRYNTNFCYYDNRNSRVIVNLDLHNNWYDLKALTHELGHVNHINNIDNHNYFNKLSIYTKEQYSITAEFMVWGMLDYLVDSPYKYRIIHLSETLRQLQEYMHAFKFEILVYSKRDNLNNMDLNKEWIMMSNIDLSQYNTFSFENKIITEGLLWKDNVLLFEKPFNSFEYSLAILKSLYNLYLILNDLEYFQICFFEELQFKKSREDLSIFLYKDFYKKIQKTLLNIIKEY